MKIHQSLSIRAILSTMQFFKKSNINAKPILDYLTVFVGNGFGRGISLLLSVLIAREVGTEGYGKFSLFFTIMMLVWQFVNVIDMTYVRFVKAEGELGQTIYIKASILLKISAFSISMVIAYPACSIIANFIFNKPESLMILFMASVSGTFLSLFYGFTAIYQALENFKVYAIMNSVYYGLVFLAVSLVWVLRMPFDTDTVLIAYILPAVALGVLGIFMLFKKVNFSTAGCKTAIQAMVKFGKWLLAENIIYLSLQRIDLLFLTRYSDFREIGIYSAAIRIAMIVSLLTSSLSLVLMPKGCESIKSEKQVARYLKESFWAVFTISLMIVIFIILCPAIMKFLFGPAYEAAIIPAKILLVEALIVAVYTPFSFLFYAAGNSRQVFFISAIKLLFAVVSLFFLAERFGSLGAALSITISSFAGLIYTLCLAKKIIKSTVVEDRVEMIP